MGVRPDLAATPAGETPTPATERLEGPTGAAPLPLEGFAPGIIGRWRAVQQAHTRAVPLDDPHALHDPALWPWWLFPSEVLAQVMIVALAAVFELNGALIPVGLLVLSLVPWNLSHLATLRIPPMVWTGLTLAPIALVNIGAERFGWVDVPGGHEPQHSLMLLVLFAFHVGVSTTRLQAIVVGAALMAVPGARLLLVPDFGHQFTLWIVAIDLGLVAGILLAYQTRLVLRLRAAQARLVDEAAARERRRIAREVHDVIAHSLAVTMLQVNAARMANDRGEAAKVGEALRDAERVGRASLDEVRGTVRLLRDGDDATATALPTGTDVAGLVADHRAAGMVLDSRLDDAVPDLDGGVGLAVYRVVQESLTNAARHAPGRPVTLAVDVGSDEVTITVDNPLPAAAAGTDTTLGLGLPGMRERVRQHGGDVEAGPVDGRWRVEATLPRATPTGGRSPDDTRPRC